MGRFIISRTAAGDSFTLQSGGSYTLAISRPYATLDACKKGIASLIANAPTVPVVDLTAGERGPNPKFEISGKEGGFFFALKSANGKAVFTSNPYATKKACLRAISMMREAVREYEVVLIQKNDRAPIAVKLPGEETPPRKPRAKRMEAAAPTSVLSAAPTLDMPLPELSEEPPELPEEPPELPEELPLAESLDAPSDVPPEPMPAAHTPRLIRVLPVEALAAEKKPAPRTSVIVGHAKRQPSSPPKKRSLLDILLKK